MSSALPRISVITPSWQQGRFLEQTLCSVLDQGYPNLDYIVIDGGSTDGSLEIIRRYEAQLAYWVREPDAGQADAINKGLRRASGDLVLWINSDDLLLPGSLRAAAQFHLEHPQDILLADVLNFQDGDDFGHLTRQYGVSLESLLALWKPCGFWHQPGTFVPRALLPFAPQLDPTLNFYFDREWICRLLSANANVTYVGQPLAAFRLHAQSKTVREAPDRLDELRQICQKFSGQLPEKFRRETPAGCALLRANYHVSPEYPTRWNRGQAWQHLRAALVGSPDILLWPYFWRVLFKLIAPQSLTNKMARSILDRKGRQAVPAPSATSRGP